MASLISTSSDFVIWGPSVNSGTVALNAVHALYYLPQQYKLVLPTATPEQQDSYDQIVSLIQRDNLGERVQFTDSHVEADRHAVIATSDTDRHPGHVFGQSPEALASAILNAARATA